MTLYIASLMREELEGVLNGVYNVRLKLQWADGQIGALPVFKNKADAEAFCSGKGEVLEINMEEKV